jgi:TetR/AcrR family transcriptional repressor of nem operon
MTINIKQVILLSMEANLTKKEATHERIVNAAARAIRRSGFEGVGVADVMKEAGLTHGGFYAHFDSREALLVEALERAGGKSLAAARAAASLAKRVDGRQPQNATMLRAIIESYLSDAHLSGTESGCPVAALASEMPRQSPELRKASIRRVEMLVERVRRTLPNPDASERAMAIVSTMVGALQLARVLGCNAKGKAMLAAARESLLAAQIPG